MLTMVGFIFGKEINTGDGLISVYTSSLISYQRSRLQYFTPWAYVAENRNKNTEFSYSHCCMGPCNIRETRLLTGIDFQSEKNTFI